MNPAVPARRTKVFFDGGCRPNPGAMETAVVVRGALYHAPDIGYGTNTDAEWLALIAALRIAQALDLADFELRGDSATVINQATGLWTCRSADLARHLRAFQDLIGEAPPRIRKISRSQNLAGIALARFHERGVPGLSPVPPA